MNGKEKAMGIMLERGSITRGEVQQIFPDAQPSASISNLRCRLREYNLKRKPYIGFQKPHPLDEWILEPRKDKLPARQVDPYTRCLGEGPNLDCVKVECMNCGYSFLVQVWPGTNPSKHNLCTDCKNREHVRDDLFLGHSGDKLSQHLERAGARWKKRLRVEPVRHIKPEDPEFKRVAPQCTPPREIKERESDSEYYWRSNY